MQMTSRKKKSFMGNRGVRNLSDSMRVELSNKGYGITVLASVEYVKKVTPCADLWIIGAALSVP